MSDYWTCSKCGKEMVFNVPRLGPDGGFVHAHNRQLLCTESLAKAALMNITLFCCHWNKVESSDKPSNETWNYQIARPEAEKYIQEVIDKSVESLQQQLAEANSFRSMQVRANEQLREELRKDFLKITQLEQERDKLLAVVSIQTESLKGAAEIFRYYAKLHLDKTPPQELKAKQNEAHALACERASNMTPSNLPSFVPEESIKDLIDALQFIADQKDPNGNWAIQIAKQILIDYRDTESEKEGV